MIDEFKIKLVFETEEKTEIVEEKTEIVEEKTEIVEEKTEIVEEKTEIKKNSVFLLLFFKKNIMLKK